MTNCLTTRINEWNKKLYHVQLNIYSALVTVGNVLYLESIRNKH